MPAGVGVIIGSGDNWGQSCPHAAIKRGHSGHERRQQPYADGSKPIDYGLIAEEVADVYPDLVVKDADGQVQTVQYHKLVPMLLNELQKERQERSETVQSLQAQVSALQKALGDLMAK